MLLQFCLTLLFFFKSTWFAFRPLSNFNINNNKGVNRDNIYHLPIMDPTLCFISFVLKLWCIRITWEDLKNPEAQVSLHTSEINMSSDGNQASVFFGNHCFISPHPLNSPLKQCNYGRYLEQLSMPDLELKLALITGCTVYELWDIEHYLTSLCLSFFMCKWE